MKIVLLFTLAILTGCNSSMPIYDTVGKKTDDPSCPDYSEVSGGFYGGDGSSMEQAVESVGVEFTPYKWIEEQHPGAKPTMQALIQSPKTGLNYDLIEFTTAEGRKEKAYFWVSGGMYCFLKASR